MKAKSQIVLLGGGYVSVWAYRSLIRKLKYEIEKGLVSVIVICPEDYHFFHGWTAESLTCIIQDQNRMSPLSEIFSKAQLIKGKAEEIDSFANIVYVTTHLGSKHAIHYDHLLIGIGSFDTEIEGLNSFGYQVKSHDAFLRTKKEIRAIVDQAAQENATTAEAMLSFTIAGGGFTGVELATNIAEFVGLLKKRYPSLHNIRPAIRLINSGGNILNVLKPGLRRMRSYTMKMMDKYGIEVINNKKIVRIAAQGVFLNDSSYIPCRMVISTIGQTRLTLKGTENMKRDAINRLYTNRYLQIHDKPNIWGGGDNCHVMHGKKNNPCPANALWAIKHGEYAGRNIARSIKQLPLKPFTYKGLGQCASLGIGKGVGEIYGIEFTGWVAWIMRWLFFNYFMPSRRVMLSELGDWCFLLFYGTRKDLPAEKQLLLTVSKVIPT